MLYTDVILAFIRGGLQESHNGRASQNKVFPALLTNSLTFPLLPYMKVSAPSFAVFAGVAHVDF